MITLLQNGAWLLNGQEIVEDTADSTTILNSKLGYVPEKKDAAAQTMAYNILQAHNTSDSKEQLKIKFDKMTSHDITFVGIIQTARASGLEKFPIPYVLTNCHNSLCAVGGTINEDDICLDLHVPRNTAAFTYRHIRQSSISLPVKCWQPVAA